MEKELFKPGKLMCHKNVFGQMFARKNIFCNFFASNCFYLFKAQLRQIFLLIIVCEINVLICVLFVLFSVM